jgi:hypothetical protein
MKQNGASHDEYQMSIQFLAALFIDISFLSHTISYCVFSLSVVAL